MYLKLTLTVAAVMLAAVLSHAGQCSPTAPLKPLPSIGCKDWKPKCQCDDKGEHCKWIWECVPR